MTRPDWWKMEPRPQSERILIQAQNALALTTMILYFYVGFYYVYIPIPSNPALPERIIFTLRWGILEILPLAIAIVVVGLHRNRHSRTSGDPRKPEQVVTPEFAVHVRFLTNTVEQAATYFCGLITFASYIEPDNWKLVPLTAILFFVGRILNILVWLLNRLDLQGLRI